MSILSKDHCKTRMSILFKNCAICHGQALQQKAFGFRCISTLQAQEFSCDYKQLLTIHRLGEQNNKINLVFPRVITNNYSSRNTQAPFSTIQISCEHVVLCTKLNNSPSKQHQRNLFRWFVGIFN